MRIVVRWFLVALGGLALACGDDDGQPPACPDGHRAEGPACVPVLDRCAGDTEVSVLGGACAAVGPTACATGFEPEGEGGCAAVLPTEPCPPGTRASLGSTACVPVGVSACADGFTSDGAGGCDPVLPAADCPEGTLEVIGEATCQPLGDCGAGPWGVIEDDGTTVYVDATAEATGADGTAGAPFTRITDALAVVTEGGQVAVAAGTYAERVVVSRPVRLRGRCAAQVTVVGVTGDGTAYPAVRVGAGGDGTAVRGLALTGPGRGLEVEDATGISVSEVQVRDTGGVGVYGGLLTGVALSRVSVVRATGSGFMSEAGYLEVDESVARDTRYDPWLIAGRGLALGGTTDGAVIGRGRLRRSLVSGSTEAAVSAVDADLDVEASVVRRTAPDPDGYLGAGLFCLSLVSERRRLRVSGSVVEDQHHQAIATENADLEITDTVIRRTLPEAASGLGGLGVSAGCSRSGGHCGRSVLRSSLVAGSHFTGVLLRAGDAEVTDVVVRDTACDQATGEVGAGLAVVPVLTAPASATSRVERSLVERSCRTGITVQSGRAEIRDVVVRDTLPSDRAALGGEGITALCNRPLGDCPTVRVSAALVESNRRVGIGTGGADLTITGSLVRGTLPEEGTGLWGHGITGRCDPESGGCGRLRVEGTVVEDCRAAGIRVRGVDTVIAGTVVRRTACELATGTGGRGIDARCDPDVLACGTLQVTESRVTDCREVGIFAAGIDAEITGTVIADTLAPETGSDEGRGISTRCDLDLGACGSLTVGSTRVERSRGAGVYAVGGAVTLHGLTVLDTLDAGGSRGGEGIAVGCDDDADVCGALAVEACLVEGSVGAGLRVRGLTGVVASTAVRDVAALEGGGMYGYGVQVDGIEAAPPPVVHLQRCEIAEVDLAGVLYAEALGTVSRSWVQGGAYGVVWSHPELAPTVAEDTVCEGGLDDAPVLLPSMAPLPASAPDALR